MHDCVSFLTLVGSYWLCRDDVHADVAIMCEKRPMWVLDVISSQRVYTKACHAQAIFSK